MGFKETFIDPMFDQTPILAWDIGEDDDGNKHEKIWFMGSWIIDEDDRKNKKITNSNNKLTNNKLLKNVTPAEVIDYDR